MWGLWQKYGLTIIPLLYTLILDYRICIIFTKETNIISASGGYLTSKVMNDCYVLRADIIRGPF